MRSKRHCTSESLHLAHWWERHPQTEVLEAVVYRIRHKRSGMIKIGISDNWERRARELKVGVTTEVLNLQTCESIAAAAAVEKQAHKLLDSYRLPQSEWFCASKKLTFVAVCEAWLKVAAPEIWRLFRSDKAQKALLKAMVGLRHERHRLLKQEVS